MKKLNNKGITTIEVLICFILVVIITISIYSTVSTFNEMKTLEGYREQILNYKNLLTKDIQDDLIKVGLTSASYDRKTEGEKSITTVNFSLKDGSERQLVVEQIQAISAYHPGGSVTSDDYYMIKYGRPNDLIERPLPDVGHYGYDRYTKDKCDVDKDDGFSCRKILDFAINNVLVDITDENVLSIYIGFYHPEFSTKYAIDIVCPIDYNSNGYDSSSNWEF